MINNGQYFFLKKCYGRRYCNSSGFSIIALIGVISIVAIFAGALSQNILKIQQDRKNEQEEKDLRMIIHSLKKYIINNQTIPCLKNYGDFLQKSSLNCSLNSDQIKNSFSNMKQDQPLFRLPVILYSLEANENIFKFEKNQTLPIHEILKWDKDFRQDDPQKLFSFESFENYFPRMMLLSSSDRNNPLPTKLEDEGKDIVFKNRFEFFWEWDGLKDVQDSEILKTWNGASVFLHVARLNLAEVFSRISFSNVPEGAFFRILSWPKQEKSDSTVLPEYPSYVPIKSIKDDPIALIKGTFVEILIPTIIQGIEDFQTTTKTRTSQLEHFRKYSKDNGYKWQYFLNKLTNLSSRGNSKKNTEISTVETHHSAPDTSQLKLDRSRKNLITYTIFKYCIMNDTNFQFINDQCIPLDDFTN